MQLHREALAVDEVLAAEGVVLAPVEVQLREDVLAVHRAAADRRQIARVDLHHDCGQETERIEC